MSEYTAEKMYREYGSRVQTYLRHRLSDLCDAEEVAQQVFLKVCANIAYFDSEKSSPSTWIYAITCNTLTDFYRRRRVNADIDDMEQLAAEQGEPLKQLLSEESYRELADALEQLETRERDVILLHYYSGVKLTELALRLRLSYPQTKRLHARALAKLRRLLEYESLLHI